MSRDPRVRLHDILASIQQIERYTTGVSLEEFRTNYLIQDAVIRRLEIDQARRCGMRRHS